MSKIVAAVLLLLEACDALLVTPHSSHALLRTDGRCSAPLLLASKRKKRGKKSGPSGASQREAPIIFRAGAVNTPQLASVSAPRSWPPHRSPSAKSFPCAKADYQVCHMRHPISLQMHHKHAHTCVAACSGGVCSQVG